MPTDPAHVQCLTTREMLDRLRSLQIPTWTPEDPARHGASVCVPSARAGAIVDAMAERGVLAWNGQGRVRFSFHGYNAARDVDRAIDVLPRAVGIVQPFFALFSRANSVRCGSTLTDVPFAEP